MLESFQRCDLNPRRAFQCETGRSPGWILLHGESPFQIDDVALVFEHPITEGDLEGGLQRRREQHRKDDGCGERCVTRTVLFIHLLVNLRARHLLQVLQVGVEQVAARQRDPQHRLDDVADGAVVGQTDFLRRVHEVAAAGTEGR